MIETDLHRQATGVYCDDCEDLVPFPQRRIRCRRCRKLVCRWCFHHGFHTVRAEGSYDGQSDTAVTSVAPQPTDQPIGPL